VLPIGIEENFKGVVDVLTRKAWIWDDSGDPMKYHIRRCRRTWSIWWRSTGPP
jgi:hypothetical protein